MRRAFTLLEVLVALAIITTLLGLILSGVQKVRTRASQARCQNNLRQVVLALHSYHATAHSFPAGVTLPTANEQYPFLSWHTRILPFLEQDSLWEEATSAYRRNPDFLGAPAHRVAEHALPVFGCPLDVRTHSPQRVADYYTRGLTSYLGVIGKNADHLDGMLFGNSAVRLTDVRDGTSCTLLVGERPPSCDMVLGWWYAGWGQNRDGEGDMILGVRTKNTSSYAPSCNFGPYQFTPGKFDNPCDAFHFWSPHSGGANFAFADGSVRFLRYSADDVLPALATRAGGEVVAVPD